MTTRQHLAAGVALIGVLCAEYAPLLTAGFVYEDRNWFIGCAVPHASIWNWHGRRLALASWCWQAAHTPSPLAFHLFDFGLHVTAMALLGAVIWALTQSDVATWIAVSVWALHPIHVEAVSYLSSRSELMAAVGILAACLAALQRQWGGVGIAAALALWSKESAIVLLVCLPLVMESNPAYVGYGWLAMTAGTLLTLVRVGMVATVWPSVSWMLTQASALVRLLALSLLPIGQTVDYDYGLVPVGAKLLAAALLCGLAVLAVRCWQRKPLVAMGLAWILLTAWPRFLVPTPLSVMNEHQFYVPSMGLALIVAGLWPLVAERRIACQP